MKRENSNKTAIRIHFCRCLAGLLFVFLFAACFYTVDHVAMGAENSANAVKIVKVDYDNLTIEIDPNGSHTVYYSDKSKKVWEEVLGEKSGSNLIMDISWVSQSAVYELNFKGNIDETAITTVTLPLMESKYKAVFDKVSGEIKFTNVPDGLSTFEWRKVTSYNWSGPIDITQTSEAGKAFVSEMEALRVKGGSIIVRLPGINSSTDTNGIFQVGRRPSKEIRLSIVKRTNGPSMTVNVGKFTMPMKITMEYTVDGGMTWKDGTTDGSLATVVPAVLYKNGTSSNVMFGVRYKEVEGKKPYSKTTYIDIPAQGAPPVMGTDVIISYASSIQMLLNFPNASKTAIYEYTIVKPGYSFDITKASWSSVNSTLTKKVSNRTAPEGSTIYIRKKGITASTTRQLELASAYISFVVDYPAP